MSDASEGAMQQWTNDIHEGDVIETMNEMPESSVHCVMTSPPYFGLRDYDAEGQIGLEETVDEYVETIANVGDEIKRVLREDGSWWLNLGDSFAGSGRGQWDNDGGQPKESYRPDNGELPDQDVSLRRKSKMLVPHRVAIALQDAGWIVRSDAVWKKTNPMPHPVKDRFNEHKEFLYHLVPNPDYWFDLDAIREPHKKTSLGRSPSRFSSAGIGTANYPGDRDESEIPMKPEDALHPNGKNPGDIIESPVEPFPDAHFAVYPGKLCKRPIKATCPPEVCAACSTPFDRTQEPPEPRCGCETNKTEPGIVLDPFAGSGTTLVVAKELGRQFVGVDINPDYVAMAQKRVGITVSEPGRLLGDGETSLTAFTDGGRK